MAESTRAHSKKDYFTEMESLSTREIASLGSFLKVSLTVGVKNLKQANPSKKAYGSLGS